MMELLASALVAAAAVAFVVEPLTRRAPAREQPGPASAEHVARARQLVAEMASCLSAQCPACAAVSDSPALYCPRCGHILLEDRSRPNSAV